METAPEDLPAWGTIALVVASQAGDAAHEVSDGGVRREGFGLSDVPQTCCESLNQDRLEDGRPRRIGSSPFEPPQKQ